MRYTSIICFLITMCLCYSYADDSGIRITGDVQASPILYDPQYNIFGLTIKTACMAGFITGSYTIGIEGLFDYSFFEGQDPQKESLGGNWITLRVLLEQYYEPAGSFYILKWGTGFVWLNNKLKNGNSDPEEYDFYGISFQFQLKILLPWKFIDIDTIHRIDLLYSFDNNSTITSMAPHYYGGFRINTHPGIPWLSIYIDSYIKYWSYSSLSNDIDTGIFNAGMGVAFDLPLRSSDKKNIRNTALNDKISEGISDSHDNPVGKEFPQVKLLQNAKQGDKINFHNIQFLKNTDILKEESIPVLNSIVPVLKEKYLFIILISAYAEYMENPAEEYKLYTARAKRIKDFLVNKGIDEGRLKISSIGQIVLSMETKTPTVIFEIIEDGIL